MAIESGEGGRVQGVAYDHGGVSGTYYAGSNLLENVVFTQVPWGGHAGAKRTKAIGIAACKFDHVGQLIFGECKLTATHRYTGGLRLGQFHGVGTEYDGEFDYHGNFVSGLRHGTGVEHIRGKFACGGVYEDDERLDADTPIAQRGYSEDVVRQLKEFHPHDTLWEQVDDEQEDGDDEQEDDRNEMHNSDGDDDHNLANSEPDDQSMGPSRDHESGIGSRQCNGKQAAGAQEEVVAEQRAKKTRRSRVSRRDAKKAEEDAAGFTTQTHRSYENEYGKGSLATGRRRDCAVLAAFNSMPDVLHKQGIDVPTLRKLMPNGGRTEDTAFSTLQTFFLKYNYDLKRVTEDYDVAGGPALNLLKETTGRFVVQLRAALNGQDKAPEFHCVAFNADTQKVIDNDAKMDPRCLEPSDTKSKKVALKVFKSCFKPGTIVEVNNIYEFLVATDSGCAPPPPKKQKATPSTDAKCVGGTSAGVNTDLAAQAAAREPEPPWEMHPPPHTKGLPRAV
jgi:hypothetical protein